MEQNERAKELYGMGFFDPNRAQEALCALEMMEFEGIDKLRDQVRQGQTLLNICMQQQQEMQQMSLLIQSLTGGNAVMGGPAPSGNGPGPAPGGGAPRPERGLARGVMQAHTPMTGYGRAWQSAAHPAWTESNPGTMDTNNNGDPQCKPVERLQRLRDPHESPAERVS